MVREARRAGVNLAKLQRHYTGYRLATRHNPKHFYPNSFEVQRVGGRLMVVGRVKKHLNKNFQVVGFLKPER